MTVFVSLLLAASLSGCGDPSAAEAAQPASSAPPASSAAVAPNAFAVFFVNVGRADATIVRLGETAVLIDTGTEESAPQLVAALNYLGVASIGAVFLTHSHDDHTGGLSALAANYDIPIVYSPLFSETDKNGVGKIVKLCEKLGLRHAECSAGQSVEAGASVSFSVLGPLEFNEEDDNDNSLVLRFSCGGLSFLFAGDAQYAEEATLLASGADLSADVLKVGNHGNPDATAEAFARAVSPRVAIVSTSALEDADSANPRVLAALSGADAFVTQNFALGVLLTAGASGEPVVVNPARPAFSSTVTVTDFSVQEQTITLRNGGESPADLSGCALYCDRSGATLRFPEGTVLPAGGALIVSADGGAGDVSFRGENKPLSRKKANAVTLFSPYGEPLSEIAD